jgi:hypothetical protein
MTRNAGYRCALTMDTGINDIDADLFRLRRISVPDDASVSKLLVKASGLWNVFRSQAHLKIRRCEVRKIWTQDRIAA